MGLRFESPISFVTRSSSPTTPSASYGIVYASGSDIYYEDDGGVEYKLNRAGTPPDYPQELLPPPIEEVV